MGNFRGWEWIIILAIVLILFGANRLPALAKSVGRSAKIFRSEIKGDEDRPTTTEPLDGDSERKQV